MFQKSFVVLCCIFGLLAARAGAQEKHDDHDHHGHDHSHDNTLVTVLKKDGRFNTFIAAASAAGIDEQLHHDTLTIFAPTDEAFAALGAEKLDQLLEPANKEKLKQLLLSHVVEGKVSADSIKSEPTTLTSLGGTKLTAKKDGDAVHINAAKVIAADVKAENGIVHGVDKVLE